MDPRIDREVAPLTVEELEAGLQILDRMDTDQEEFWDANGAAFTETVRLAIRETSEALLFRRMSATLRAELESQLEWLSKLLEQDGISSRKAALRDRPHALRLH